MATLDCLKKALRSYSSAIEQQPLSDEQYSIGFDALLQGSRMSYQDFIIPQLSQLLGSFFESRASISILEVGPGPSSVLRHLPDRLRRKIRTYTAFEPNRLFAARLTELLCSTPGKESVLPCLEKPSIIHQLPFDQSNNVRHDNSICPENTEDKHDLILFCHSMYGMKSRRQVIEQTLRMVVEEPQKGMVAVFHRSGSLHFDDLVCYRTTSFSTGVVHVADKDELLDSFATFITGCALQDSEVGKTTQANWREVCRTLGRREEAYPDHLLFSAPEIMVAFTQDATSLPELTAQVPLAESDMTIKNWEARLHRPVSTLRPTEVQQVQQCVRWALKHEVCLTVVGGGHSGHCLWPTVVSIDMGAFDRIYILTVEGDGGDTNSDSGSFAIVEAGCKTGDIIRKTMAAGRTVPLGARPSVGAGLWLQGGIGHLARRHGLACDAIVGAVMVSVKSGQILYVGHVPSQHRPSCAILPECERDLLWAMKGAGTNYGIVISVTLKTYTAPTYLVQNWIAPLDDNNETRLRLSEFDKLVAKKLDRNSSADGYLYRDGDRLHFGITMIECSTTKLTSATPTPALLGLAWQYEDDIQVVDGVGLFETEMYMSKLHGGHGGGKTHSFKRCLFFKEIGDTDISSRLAAAMEICPTPLCYLHLLQGGGAVENVAVDATAFGCRDWDFACVVTGVWYRDQDHAEAARSAVQWVYKVVSDLLHLSTGAYSADLGPDPRDAALAARAFGPNRSRLARLKRRLDPHNVLAYTCPLPKAPIMEPKLIILVTGESCAGKDFSADVWLSVFKSSHESLTARVVSISDATKREYAMATGADLSLLLNDRTYKERHRPKLTEFFQEQVRERPQLPEEHFLSLVRSEADADVLIITGMREEAPVATLSHLVPDGRLLEVHVQASEQTRRIRRGCPSSDANDGHDDGNKDSNLTTLDYCPSLIFNNDATGEKAAKKFAEHNVLPFLHEDLQQLASMVRSKLNFPRQGTDFRHVLGIPQQRGGLALCTSGTC